jgi:hypothetical protein
VSALFFRTVNVYDLPLDPAVPDKFTIKLLIVPVGIGTLYEVSEVPYVNAPTGI